MAYKPGVWRERFFENEVLPPDQLDLVWPTIGSLCSGVAAIAPAATEHEVGGDVQVQPRDTDGDNCRMGSPTDPARVTARHPKDAA